jgi:GDP-4-dehydro-6-deoxy-D-mannose reductase
MTVLVTGGSGFAGSSLVELLVARGEDVTVLSRSGAVGHLAGVQGVRFIAGEITDRSVIEGAIEATAPQHIFHLAARTFVPDSYADPTGFIEVNVIGTARLLAAARAKAPEASVLIVSSAGAYGASGVSGKPLSEDAPLRPVDPYAASKAAAELWALQEEAGSDLTIICARPFGHIGPRQEPRFVVADFARQIGRIRRGEQPPLLEVGNLDTVREFNDVADIASGYLMLMEKGRSGRVYNLCSGRGVRVGDLLAMMLARAGVSADVVPRPERMRPADVPSLLGNPARIQAELGWQATTPLEETLDRVLERWGARAS